MRKRSCRNCVAESITGDVAGAGVTATGTPFAKGGAVGAGDAPVARGSVVDQQAVRAPLTGIAVGRAGADRRGVDPRASDIGEEEGVVARAHRATFAVTLRDRSGRQDAHRAAPGFTR